MLYITFNINTVKYYQRKGKHLIIIAMYFGCLIYFPAIVVVVAVAAATAILHVSTFTKYVSYLLLFIHFRIIGSCSIQNIYILT